MPTVGKKKYPYTKAGKAAAKAGARKLGKGASKAAKKAGIGSIIMKGPVRAIKAAAGGVAGRLAKSTAKSKITRANEAIQAAGLKRSNKAATARKRLPKRLGRTPAQIKKMQGGMKRATQKRKAGKGRQR
jgi:hypothetical protein